MKQHLGFCNGIFRLFPRIRPQHKSQVLEVDWYWGGKQQCSFFVPDGADERTKGSSFMRVIHVGTEQLLGIVVY